MKVLTLDQRAFEASCYQLADEIIKNYKPVAIIGVCTGGAVVANYVCSSFHDKNIEVKCLEVSASRYTSKVKRKVSIDGFFNLLPFFLLNVLRKAEHYFLKFTMKFQPQQDRNVSISKSLFNYLEFLNEGCVCIIDDAIDSGATIKSILDKFNTINSKLDYKVAALVVTQELPIVIPDVSLYSNVLLRFPWSSDFKP